MYLNKGGNIMFMHGGRFFFNSGHMFNPWFFWGSRVLGLLVIVIVAFLIYKLYKKNNTNNTNNEDLLEMLKMKYIKGEITEEEYNKKREMLKK